MNELFDWLDRLEALAVRAQTEPVAITEHLHRVFAPSRLDFDEFLVRVEDGRQEAYAFGALPGHLSVLAWPDEEPAGGTLGDQAIAAQIGGLLTLATNRRVQVAASDIVLTREGSTNRVFLPTNSVLDRGLSAPITVDPRSELKTLLEAVYGLAAEDRETISAAIELHYAATLLINVDPNAAYALVVAGLERLSRRYGDVPVDWRDWEHAPRMDLAFEELALSDDQIARLRAEMLADRHLRLRHTFASYASERLTDEFWSLEMDDAVPGIEMTPDGSAIFRGVGLAQPIPISKLVPSDRAVLRRRLLRSYDARSSYVHEGRRREAAAATVGEIVGREGAPTEPLAFAGLRMILRELVLAELAQRSTGRDLPPPVMRHGPTATAAALESRLQPIAGAITAAVLGAASLEKFLIVAIAQRIANRDGVTPALTAELFELEQQTAGRLLGRLRELDIADDVADRIDHVISRRNWLVHHAMEDAELVIAMETGEGLDAVVQRIEQIAVDCQELINEFAVSALQPLLATLNVTLPQAIEMITSADPETVAPELREQFAAVRSMLGWVDISNVKPGEADAAGDG